MAFALSSLFGSRQPPLIGVDISASSVKVVELAPGTKTAMRLERYAIEPLPRGAIVDGNIENVEAVAEAITRAVSRCGSKTRNVAIALPSSAVITKRITLPGNMTDDDYEIQVESEASQYIPFPIDEVNLDFQILGPAKIEDEVEVLLAASRKEKVEDRVAVAEMAGLRPSVVDVAQFAGRSSLDHAVAFLPGAGAGMVVALLDIGQSNTTLTVVLNGQTIFEREQAFGGQQLTHDIMRLYGLTVEEAEQKKRTGDLPDSYRADLLQPFVEQAAIEATRALQFFFTSSPYTRVDRIFVAGGSAIVEGLITAIAERAQVPTELISPFQGMEVSDNVRERQLRLDAPALMVGCGLAMRRFAE